ncbi:MAG: acetyl-CoA C-acyltransferase family protein [Gammaproteobacteria bacterium]|jgi:acetyl-CoA C-acetyltransferase|nr:acetyl-CoA C-acyltransferase family protein [Gammaproteobacteria bacterium]
MSQIRDVVVVSGTRTAIGTYGGSLKNTPPAELAATVVREAISRAGLSGEDIEHTVIGNVIHTEPRDMYISRVASVNGGVPIETPAYTVNRLCGSGLQAIVSAAQIIMLGDADTAIAGGVENMSAAPYWSSTMRWGQRMGEGKMIDAMNAALHDPFDACHMGITAENIAEKYNISREEQDAFAVESHRRAAKAIDEGHFKEQITPIELKSRKGTTIFDTDEHVRRDASIEGMAKLATVFKKDGSVTAGNASGINDGAAALTLVEANYAEKKGLQPMARLVAYAHAGVEPLLMGTGPIPAVRKLMEKTGLSIDEMDVIESNEAFAVQAMSVSQDLQLSSERVNPNGGAIALGHPVGATGSIITVKALYELQRIGGRYALVTMCIGGGQGIAAVFERI